MKKTITLALLSTISLYPEIKAADPLDLAGKAREACGGSERSTASRSEGSVDLRSEDCTVEGSEALTSKVLEAVMFLVRSIDEGKLPVEFLDIFKDVPRVKLPLTESRSPLTSLKRYLNEQWEENISSIINAFLKIVTTTPEGGTTYPLAQSLFGEIRSDLTADEFFTKIEEAYRLFALNAPGDVSLYIHTPRDFVACQFIGLFLENWLSRMNVILNLEGLSNPALVPQAIHSLKGVLALNILRLHTYDQADQVETLCSIAEIRPGRTQVTVSADTINDLERSLKALTDPALDAFASGSKIDVNLILNFMHSAFHEDIVSLRCVFEGVSDRTVPYVWDLMLRLKNMENVAYGDLTPMIRSLVRSPFGGNLCIGTFTPDKPAGIHVIRKLREEFLAPESQVKMLDFEGSQLCDEGWEQLALLAESGKPFYKIRLTGMKFSPQITVRRLGALRVTGINMAGCEVAAGDLKGMVSGWLGEGSTLKGIDLRGNDVDGAIVEQFASAGFQVYFQNRVLPHGMMFAKP